MYTEFIVVEDFKSISLKVPRYSSIPYSLYPFFLFQITGDYLKTAVAIAEMVSILDPSMDEEESAVDCSKLRPHGAYLSNHELDAITWHRLVLIDNY